MESINSKSKNLLFLRRNGSIIGLIILTIGLMFVFKYFQKDINNLIDEGINLYTQNLKPLFIKEEITNEDIINFAFYETLPIDKQNSKYIILGNDSAGNDNFVIKTKETVATTNYEKFININELDEKRVQILDSILNTYKEDIYTSILFNENNTYAVSHSLPHLRDLLRYDLVLLTEKASELGNIDKRNFIWTSKEPEVTTFRHKIRTASREDFIFFNPETVFASSCQFDKSKFTIPEIKKYQVEKVTPEFEFKVMCKDKELGIKKPFEKTDEIQILSVYKDNELKIVVPERKTNIIDYIEEKELLKEIENLKKELSNISISIWSDSGNVNLNIKVLEFKDRAQRYKNENEAEQMKNLKNIINILPKDFNIQIDIDTLSFDYNKP
ncbi:MAG: hypothetical protein JW866_00280 [Ignavibacteriales bacterium]|nr:hypothetical protein [Ignavibacteriales bacterium]